MMVFTSENKRTDKHVDIVNISAISSDLQNDVCTFHPSILYGFRIWIYLLYMKYKANVEEAELQLVLPLNKANYRQGQQFFESNRLYDHFELTALVRLIKIYQM